MEFLGVAMGMVGVCGVSKTTHYTTILYYIRARTVEKFKGFPNRPKSRRGEVFGPGWNENPTGTQRLI